MTHRAHDGAWGPRSQSRARARAARAAGCALAAAFFATACLSTACRTPRHGSEPSAVRPGLEVLLTDSLPLVQGRRVGLITNRTAVARDGTHAIDLLREAPGVRLTALFAPEHGIRGRAAPGERIPDDVDPATGLPIRSLYGVTRQPTPAMLADLDVLVFDIQTLDARPYTYAWTMALAMEAAGEAGIPFLVLDRPVPTGAVRTQGNVLDPLHASFVGLHPVPLRYAMTIGELALLLNDDARQRGRATTELHVVPMTGWRRAMTFDETSLPWIPPSPNIPDLESAFHYPGTVLFEGTNLSVGRGTDRAFQLVGAPWLDGEALAARLAGYRLPGVRVEPAEFTPRAPADGKFPDQPVRGIRLTVTDRAAYDPTVTAVAALLEARRLAGGRWEWNAAHFDRLAGDGRLREAIEAGRSLDEIVAPWAAERERFEAFRAPRLLYP